MSNYIESAIKSLNRQADKLQERIDYWNEKKKEASANIQTHSEQLELLKGQIQSLKGESVVNGKVMQE